MRKNNGLKWKRRKINRGEEEVEEAEEEEGRVSKYMHTTTFFC